MYEMGIFYICQISFFICRTNYTDKTKVHTLLYMFFDPDTCSFKLFLCIEQYMCTVKDLNKWVYLTLVPKLTLGPFLILSVRNGHKLK